MKCYNFVKEIHTYKIKFSHSSLFISSLNVSFLACSRNNRRRPGKDWVIPSHHVLNSLFVLEPSLTSTFNLSFYSKLPQYSYWTTLIKIYSILSQKNYLKIFLLDLKTKSYRYKYLMKVYIIMSHFYKMSYIYIYISTKNKWNKNNELK